MKILLSNKFYYPRGGSDIYMLELEKLLKDNGHQVAVFAMQHPLNLKSEFSGYFPGEIDLNQQKPGTLVPALIRPFGSLEVRKNFNRLLNDFRPDIVHLNNIHSQLSPILSILARNRKVPVVWTLHDHKLLCPRYDCMRNNKPCELCFRNKFNVIRYRCMKNSLVASMVAYAEALTWNKSKVGRSTAIFICPSAFLLKNMVKGGFRQSQLVVLPNFINRAKINGTPVIKNNYYCFVGRLSGEKGIETLLRAAAELPQYNLKIIGTGPLESELKAKYNLRHVEFLGYLNWNDLRTTLGNSSGMAITSECYENNPLSVIESLCLGTPVIGSGIGGIPELISEGRNGYIFEPGNVADLRKTIDRLFTQSVSQTSREIATDAFAKYDSARYYEAIIKIYANLLSGIH